MSERDARIESGERKPTEAVVDKNSGGFILGLGTFLSTSRIEPCLGIVEYKPYRSLYGKI